MKTRSLGLLFAVIAYGFLGNAQTAAHGVVFEPPEMTMAVNASPAPTPSADDLAFADAVKQFGKNGYDPANLPILDKFIQDHPNYANAYFWRAFTETCGDRPLDIAKAKTDLESALLHRGSDNSMFEQKDVYPLQAKIEVASGNHITAISLLERAMMADLSSADKIFNVGGVSPETTSSFCEWNLTDLHKLASSSPKDWRPVVFEGLYYRFFTTFNESYYPQATAALQRAALLNPRTPIIPYLQGELHVKSAFWTKKAWSSDAAREEMYRAAIPFFTKAIELDSGFEPAYASRAEAYLESKQDSLAIKDFTKVLSLQPNNSTAFADRGIANGDIGQSYAAISDFGDAIRLKEDGNNYLPTLHENRADAYAKLADYRRAIEDYSTAIELQLKTQVLLLNLQQFRGIYPEYTEVSDDLLLDNLYHRFPPHVTRDDFRKMLTEQNGKWGVSFLLTNLYEKRGDAYLSIGNYRRGILDFQRIFVGAPDFGQSTERWRSIGTSKDGERYYIDVKSSEPLSKGFPRTWVKSAGSKGSDVMAFEFDCPSRKYRVTTNVNYDKDGNVIGHGYVSDVWDDVIPDTLSEQLWNGVCQSNQ